MNMKRFPALASVAAGLLLLASGCTTISGPQPKDQLPTPGFTTTTPSGGTQISDSPSPPSPPAQAALSPELQEAVAKLNIQVQVTSSADLNADEFEQSVCGQLANAGFAFLPAVQPDLRMNIALESELFDKSGNYFVYRGRAVTELWRNIDGKQLAGNTFDAKGERKLGERAAALNLQKQLVTSVNSWIAGKIMPDRIGIAAAELSLAMHRFKILKGGDQDEIARVIKAIQGIPGVHSCRLIENNAAIRLYRFRVIYYPEKLPMGLSNAAAEACGYRTN